MSARQYWQASTLVLAITLTFALLVAPLVAEAQVARKVYQLGILSATAGLGADLYRCVGPGSASQASILSTESRDANS
jgi:hypothetical protein